MKPHRARAISMQAVFQAEFNPRDLEELEKFDWIDYELPQDEKDFVSALIEGVYRFKNDIDSIIKNYSINWDFTRISPVNKAILRISIFQLLHMKEEIPPHVAIDEAIKLSKEYAEKDSSRFINGMLDNFYKKDILKTTVD